MSDIKTIAHTHLPLTDKRIDESIQRCLKNVIQSCEAASVTSLCVTLPADIPSEKGDRAVMLVKALLANQDQFSSLKNVHILADNATLLKNALPSNFTLSLPNYWTKSPPKMQPDQTKKKHANDIDLGLATESQSLKESQSILLPDQSEDVIRPDETRKSDLVHPLNLENTLERRDSAFDTERTDNSDTVQRDWRDNAIKPTLSDDTGQVILGEKKNLLRTLTQGNDDDSFS